MVCSLLRRNYLPRNFSLEYFQPLIFPKLQYIYNTYSVHSDTIRCTVPSDTTYICMYSFIIYVHSVDVTIHICTHCHYTVYTVSLYMYTVSLYVYVHSITIQCTHVQCPYTVLLYSVCNVTIKFTIQCTQGHYQDSR